MRRRVGRADKVRCIVKEIGVRGIGPGVFQPGHRMASDEWYADRFGFAADRDFRAAHVCYQRILAGKCVQQFEYVSNGRCQDNQVRTFWCDSVDDL